MENLSKLLDAEKRQKALHARTGVSRHSRFGTTVAFTGAGQKIVLHKQNAITADPGKILDAVKRKRAGRLKKVVCYPQRCRLQSNRSTEGAG
jgi:replication fork protection complex subunit Tof1/Swi1